MIKGKTYFFFRLDRCENDTYPEYRIAESVEDLYLRYGDSMSHFSSITQLNEFTSAHLYAINCFLLQQHRQKSASRQ